MVQEAAAPGERTNGAERHVQISQGDKSSIFI
jgi:hypothetical protein